MWWEGSDSETFQTVARLNSQFLDELKTAAVEDADSISSEPSRSPRAANITYGVGSTTGRNQSGRVPLLFIDAAFAPGGYGSSWRWPARLGGPDHRFIAEHSRSRTLVRFGDVDDDVKRIFERWSIPENAEVLFTPVPVTTSAGSGAQVWAGRRDATIGFVLSMPQHSTKFSTAGHLARDPLPIAIEARNMRWFGRRHTKRIGSVSFATDPTDGNPGVDVALIDPQTKLDWQWPCPARPHEACPCRGVDPVRVTDLSDVIIRGARSGSRRGWLVGAMLSTRSIGPRLWKNCWTIAEYRGGLVQKGDSGGPVELSADGNMLGHVVAAIGGARWNGRRQLALVQDMRTIVEHLESRYGPPVFARIQTDL